MLGFRNVAWSRINRLLSTSSTNILEHLKHKSLLRISGTGVSDFLQSLITNDIAHLGGGYGSMYTMFLNSRGRILYDAITYRYHEQDTYLVECDIQASDALQKHIKLFRVRRKIDVRDVGDELKVYVLYNDNNIQEKVRGHINVADDGMICYHTFQQALLQRSNSNQDLLVYRDPRISLLGSRIIAKKGTDVLKRVCQIIPSKIISNNKHNYRWLRYSLGVGEGIEDLPPEESFPLECNCDYLHGVSFHKGCYVGQELTARIYHTGVVRKRLMPIHFTQKPTKPPDEKVVQDNVNLGKFRGVENDAGLGLFRFAETQAFKEIKFGDGIGAVCKPNWWPSEAPKEKSQIAKT